jgi:hypothetical protein
VVSNDRRSGRRDAGGHWIPAALPRAVPVVLKRPIFASADRVRTTRIIRSPTASGSLVRCPLEGGVASGRGMPRVACRFPAEPAGLSSIRSRGPWRSPPETSLTPYARGRPNSAQPQGRFLIIFSRLFAAAFQDLAKSP